ncbi:excisionase [Salmonella enterica subsp. enterica serovar Bovismorbificans]|uniref:Excisionase n=1 Tax=Salmonella enterica subsp. enterica serovar Bovismorbificans TaxID=58097 RepID=A0A655DN28_SALET|nr:excisionase [Salmonella enterica subsp. enterica serovar Bovismorbificans]
MSNIIQLTPNKWVSEKVLIAVPRVPAHFTRRKSEAFERMHIQQRSR